MWRSGTQRQTSWRVLLGDKEWELGMVRVKDLSTRKETDVKPEDLC